MKMKLIYVMDPLCGWCYGNNANTQKLHEKYKNVLDFEVLPAGMWSGNNVRKQSRQMATYFKKHDLQIHQKTGAEFGKRYLEFIENENIVLNSEIPSRAITTIKKLWPSQSVPFTIEVLKARYWYGKDLNDDETYLNICTEFQLNQDRFSETFHSESLKLATIEIFNLARKYAYSYPTLLAEKDGKTVLLEQGFSSYQHITAHIEQLLLEASCPINNK